MTTKSIDLENEIPILDLKGRLTYIVIKAILWFFWFMPKPLFKAFCFVAYRLAYQFSQKQKKIISRNINFIYKLPPHSNFSKSFVRQVMKHQVYSSLESFRFIKKYDQFEFSGLEDFKKNLDSCGENGVVAITGHLGAWELLARITPLQTSKEFYAVAKPSKNSGMSKVLNEIRNENGTEILWSGQSSLLRDMSKVLKDGNMLALVMDQKPKNRQGPSVNFLGIETTFVAGPATLTTKLGSSTFAFFCMREGFCKYRLFTSNMTDLSMDLRERTQSYASKIEEMIRVYPEQWCWNYRRWTLKEKRSENL